MRPRFGVPVPPYSEVLIRCDICRNRFPLHELLVDMPAPFLTYWCLPCAAKEETC